MDGLDLPLKDSGDAPRFQMVVNKGDLHGTSATEPSIIDRLSE